MPKYKDKYLIHEITGATSKSKKDKVIESFQTDDKPQIIVANVIAGGVGITLTKAHVVMFAEIDWTPSNIMQAEARVHRITQDTNVQSIFLIADNSLDARIIEMIEHKLKLIKETIRVN